MPQRKLKKASFVFAVGGTGGHIYPAQACAQEFSLLYPEEKIFFMGGKLSTNRYFSQENFPYQEISSGRFCSKNPITFLLSLGRTFLGVVQSLKSFLQHRPKLVVGFGSFYCFPVLAAAWILRVPFALHEGNSLPGRVTKIFSKHASLVGVQFPSAKKLLKGALESIPLPIRKEEAVLKEEALSYYGLKKGVCTCLVFGGSQGANFISSLMESLLPFLKEEKLSLQCIHLTGSLAMKKRLAESYAEYGVRACVKEYEESMNIAWSACDFVISRAGASTIAEQLYYKVPGILIPFPFAKDLHQDRNAEFFAKEIQGGEVFYENKDSSEKAEGLLKQLLKDETTISLWKENIAVYAKESQAQVSLAERIYQLVQEVQDES